LPSAGKTELLGEQKEQIHLEFSSARLAALGISPTQLIPVLTSQNSIVPSGIVEAGPERILLRISRDMDDAEAIAAVNLRVGDRFFALSELATVSRGYEDPPQSLFRYDGKPAIGLSIGMRAGGNILEFGRELDGLMAAVSADLPVGIEMAKFADQPQVVKHAVGHFIQAL